jgi:hypothetical protein
MAAARIAAATFHRARLGLWRCWLNIPLRVFKPEGCGGAA